MGWKHAGDETRRDEFESRTDMVSKLIVSLRRDGEL